MKKICSVLLVAVILSLFAGCGSSNKKADGNDSERSSKLTAQKSDTVKKSDFPEPHAASAIVIDANSGDVIYNKDAEKKLCPANTTNIMTAIVALENASLGDTFTVTGEALAGAKYDHSDLRINEGESYTLEQLLYPLLLTSVNDAAPYANVIAIGVSGSVDAFVDKMNQKAKDLELKNTKFTNPSGVYDENHYSTAADLAKLAKYAMQNTSIQQIVRTDKYTVGSKTFYNTNNLVSRQILPHHYDKEKALGIKASYSEKAGYCLVAAAKTDELYVITVVMGCENADKNEGAYSFVDTKKMYDYVFDNYKSVLLIEKGHHLDSSKVINSKDRVTFTVNEDVYMILEKNADVDAIKTDIEITREVAAPVRSGDRYGTVTYSYGGASKTVDVIAAHNVKRDNASFIFGKIFGFIFNPFVILIIILIVAAWVRMNIIRERRRKIRRKRLISQNGENSAPSRSRTSYRSRSFDRSDDKKDK